MVSSWYPAILNAQLDLLGSSTLKMLVSMLDAAAHVETMTLQDVDAQRHKLINKGLFCTPFVLDFLARAPGFTWDGLFRPEGELLTELSMSFDFEGMYDDIISSCTCDSVGCSTATVLPLLLHWGDIEGANGAKETAIRLSCNFVSFVCVASFVCVIFSSLIANRGCILANADRALLVYKEMSADFMTYGYSKHAISFFSGTFHWQMTLPMLGRHAEAAELFTEAGFTQGMVEIELYNTETAWCRPVTAPNTDETADGCLFDGACLATQACAFYTLASGQMPAAGGMLMSVEPDDLMRRSMLGLPGRSSNTQSLHGWGCTCWVAMAFERLGLSDRALAFADKATSTDLAGGGNPTTWTRALAHSCRGRVLAALGRATEAEQSFEAGLLEIHGLEFWFIEASILHDLVERVLAPAGHQAEGNRRLAAVMSQITAPTLLETVLAGRHVGWREMLPLAASYAPAAMVETDMCGGLRGKYFSVPKGDSDDGALESLRSELMLLKMSELKKRALKSGVDDVLVGEVDDADDPKAKVISILVSAAQRVLASQVAANPDQDALRAQLTPLRVKQLKQRALAAGVDSKTIEDVDDADDPKEAIIVILLEVAEAAAELALHEAELDSDSWTTTQERTLALTADASMTLPDSPRFGTAEWTAEAISTDSTAQMVALRAELTPLKLSALRKRAAAAGVSEAQLDEADDSDNVKAAVVELVAHQLWSLEPVQRREAAAKKVAAEKVAAEQVAAEKAVAEAEAVEKRAAERAAERVAAKKVASEKVVAENAKLRAELAALPPSQLRKRAMAAGITAESVEVAEDSSSPKEGMIVLILGAEAAGSGDRALREELEGLKTSQLRKRAVAVGITAESIEVAEDSADPKEGMIVLILRMSVPKLLSNCDSQLRSSNSRPHHGNASGGARLDPARRAIIPNGKHAMLSYNWDHQKSVLKALKALQSHGVKCWMDVDGVRRLSPTSPSHVDSPPRVLLMLCSLDDLSYDKPVNRSF